MGYINNFGNLVGVHCQFVNIGGKNEKSGETLGGEVKGIFPF